MWLNFAWYSLSRLQGIPPVIAVTEGELVDLYFQTRQFMPKNDANEETAMSAIRQVSTTEFVAEVIDSPVPVLVDFYADWCGPCRMLAPALETLAQEYSGRIKIVKVNVDQEPILAGQFRVQSIPTLLAFRDGRLIDTLVGVGSPGQLRGVLTQLAGSPSRPVVRAG